MVFVQEWKIGDCQVSIEIIMPERVGTKEIDIEEVRESDDAEYLHDLFIELCDEIMNCKAFIDGHRVAGFDGSETMRRLAGKLGFMNFAYKTVERRLLELGETPDYPPTDPRKVKIRELEAKIKELGREAQNRNDPD